MQTSKIIIIFFGQMKKNFIKYGKTTEGMREFILTEGNYILTVEKDKRHVENLQFSISSKKTTIVDISYSTDEKELKITRK